MNARRGWSAAALVFGLGVFVVTGVILSLRLHPVEPLDGAYGGEAMLAFELAETPAELARVIGSDPPSAEALAVRQDMDRANHIDFLYMFLYAGFIACSCGSLALVHGRRWLWLGALLGPLAAVWDIAENMALLSLTKPGADVPALLAALHVRTLAKWELLAVASALFAAGFVGGSRRPVTVAAATVAILAVAAGVLAALSPASFIAPLAYVIAVVWIWQLAFAAVVFGRTA
ncbi:MAG: hypothetical protein P4L83_00570 [Nevskia sp.]|nr:hypothetical protein [Nevskia sp.]